MKTIALAALLAVAPLANAQQDGMHGMGHGDSMKMMPMPRQSGTASAPKDVTVQGCWLRLLPGSVPSGGYFTIKNGGTQQVSLTGVRTDAFGMSMLHVTKQDKQGMSSMSMVHDVKVPANGQLAFTPGSYHVMLEKPAHQLQIGSQIPLTLIFEGGQEITTQCDVRPPNATTK